MPPLFFSEEIVVRFMLIIGEDALVDHDRILISEVPENFHIHVAHTYPTLLEAKAEAARLNKIINKER